MPRARICFAVVAVTLIAASPPLSSSPTDDPPPGVEQLLPRGGIPAIFAPRFVPASEAEIPDNAWVLGVADAGSVKAYSLNLLNQHEVVNDRLGERPVAAVW